MRGKRKLCAVGAAIGMIAATPALGADYEVIAGGGLESVSVFRGTKSRRLNPAIYGFLEISYGDVTGGVFSNPVVIANEKSALVVGYVTVSPEVLGLDAEIGARRYAFPDTHIIEIDLDGDGLTDHSGSRGLTEFIVGAKKNFEHGRLSIRAFYSPDTFAETGQSLYVWTEGRLDLPYDFQLRADFGASFYEKEIFNDDYVDYGVSLHRSLLGFDFFMRYSDTAGLAGPDNSVVAFGIEKSFTLFSSGQDYERRYRKILNRWSVEKSQIGFTR